MSCFKDNLNKEEDRWILWLPVALAAGIAFYFALWFEPPLWLGPVLMGLFFLPLLGKGLHSLSRERIYLALFIGLFGLGFTVISTRAHLVSAPVLAKKTFAVNVSGAIERVGLSGRAQKIVIANPVIEGIAPENTPKKVRIKVNGLKLRLNEGDEVSLKAILMPPPFPAEPHSYDIPRKFWFEQLGGVGYAVSKVTVLKESISFSAWLGRVRADINFAVINLLPKDTAGVAMSLLTGEQGGNSRKIIEAYRSSGIAHMLSVSGLHMTMVAGIVFGTLRLVLALFPFLALRFNLKKIAAIGAIIASFAYLLVSGMAVPAERAFIMVLVVLLAAIFDRQAISMRTIGLALFAILLWHPEALVGASLQMSFAAVYALIAAYETGMAKYTSASRSLERKGKSRFCLYLMAWVVGIVLTDFVASAATTPFALYHFNRIAVYSMLCNFITGPVLGFFVMPMLILFALLFPFGAGDWALTAAGQGIDFMNMTALWIQNLPASVAVFPAMPMWGLVLCIGGGLWLCLFKTAWRFWGAVAVLLGLLTPLLHTSPDVLASAGGKLFAISDGKGNLLIEPSRKNRITKEIWLSRNGDNYSFYDKRVAEEAWDKGFKNDKVSFICAVDLCVYETKGKMVALTWTFEAMKEACSNDDFDVVFSKTNAKKEYCKAKELIDRKAMWKNGAYALYLKENGAPLITNDVLAMGGRLWTP